MSDPLDPLQRWQRDIEAKLNAEEYFVDIPVYVLRPREEGNAVSIQTKIDQALAGLVKKGGKAGAAVVVLMPLADVPDRDPSGPIFQATLTIRVQELPLVNMGADGTLKPVEEIALTAMNILHRFIPGSGLQQQGFSTDAYTPSLEFDPKLTIDLKLQARFGLVGPARVQMPVIAGTASAVQLSCNTPGAVIYYTTDYSFPGRDKNLYSLPFPVPEANTMVRAAAYKPDTHQGSDVNYYLFTDSPGDASHIMDFQFAANSDYLATI